MIPDILIGSAADDLIIGSGGNIQADPGQFFKFGCTCHVILCESVIIGLDELIILVCVALCAASEYAEKISFPVIFHSDAVCFGKIVDPAFGRLVCIVQAAAGIFRLIVPL